MTPPLEVMTKVAELIQDKFQEADGDARLKALCELSELWLAVEQQVQLTPRVKAKDEEE